MCYLGRYLGRYLFPQQDDVNLTLLLLLSRAALDDTRGLLYLSAFPVDAVARYSGGRTMQGQRRSHADGRPFLLLLSSTRSRR